MIGKWRGSVGGIGGGRGVVIRKKLAMGGNTQRELGDVCQTTNGIRLSLPLSKSGRGMYEIEKLVATYRERVEANNVSIQVMSQRRYAMEE